MTPADRQSDLFPLRVLLFAMGGRRFAARADQVAATAGFSPAGGDEDLLRLDRLAGFTAGLEPAGTGSAGWVVASLRGRGGPSRRMVIGALEDITDVEAGDIRPMPPLVEGRARARGMWGVLPRQDRLYILVDLISLAGLSHKENQPRRRRAKE